MRRRRGSLKWIDPPPYQNLRCAEYSKPTKCKVATKHKHFCIDREEYTDGNTKNDAGEDLPVVRKSWLDAKSICEARGARLCKESEWELACEGPDISPYPYGWKRDSTLCNFDRTDLGATSWSGDSKLLYFIRLKQQHAIQISNLLVNVCEAKSRLFRYLHDKNIELARGENICLAREWRLARHR